MEVNINLYAKLEQRAEEGRPVRVGVIGAGKFNTMFAAQAQRTKGIQIAGITDLNVDRARDALIKFGWPSDSMTTTETTSQLYNAATMGLLG